MLGLHVTDNIHKNSLGLGTHAVAKTAFYPVKFAKRIVQVWKYEQFSASEPKILQSLHTIDQAQDPHLHPDRALQAFQILEDAYPVERKRTHTETQDGEMATDQAAEDETLEQDPTVSNSQGAAYFLKYFMKNVKKVKFFCTDFTNPQVILQTKV